MRGARRGVGLLAAALLMGAAAGAPDRVVIEDWAQDRPGTRGIPSGWKSQTWGSAAYDFAVAENDGHNALHLRSRNDGSTITRDIRGKVRLATTPVLEWRWKAVVLPKGGNSCRKATDDQAVQLYVVWPRFPEAIRSRIIGYVWDTTAKVGTICPSEKTGTVNYVVVRSGDADLGTWVTEQRNVREDFKQIYGEEPEDPAGLALTTDSNDTKSASEAYVGPILFRAP